MVLYEVEIIVLSESGGKIMQEKNHNEAVREVCSQVAKEVDELYNYFRRRNELEEETDTLRQLEILTGKKYISYTYLGNLESMINCYEDKRIGPYLSEMQDYKIRIRYFLDSYS